MQTTFLEICWKSNIFKSSNFKAEEMIGDLKKAMEVTLLNADWIDEQTRQAALVKLEHMGHKIGYVSPSLKYTF